MEIKTIERIMIGLLVLGMLLIFGGLYSCSIIIKNGGGVKNIIIEVGTDIKEIKEEINKEDK